MMSPSFLLLSLLCLELSNVNCQSKILVHCLNNAVQDTLQNLVHTADIVVSGRVQQTIEGGSKGTQVATVYYYYAYKWNVDVLNNNGVIKIYNFPPMSTVNLLQSSALFFLVQEPDGILALLCYSALTSITMYRVIKNGGDISTSVNIDDLLLSVLDQVEEVGLADSLRNLQLVNTTGDPCQTHSPCSAVGGFCNSRNTRPGAKFRCVCLTGYTGDGFTCTELVSSTKTCSQCRYGALCTNDEPPKCTCDQIQCTSSATNLVCGTNGQTYNSVCHLGLESCSLQEPIAPLYNGPCQVDVILPCGDLGTPLIVNNTLVQCSQCPQEYFCHTTSLYEVCCAVSVQGTNTRQPSLSTDITLGTTIPQPTPTGQPSYSGDGEQSDNEFE